MLGSVGVGGTTAILLLDDADRLSAETLSALSAMTRGDAKQGAAIAIVLAGSPSLASRLDEDRDPLPRRKTGPACLADPARAARCGILRLSSAAYGRLRGNPDLHARGHRPGCPPCPGKSASDQPDLPGRHGCRGRTIRKSVSVGHGRPGGPGGGRRAPAETAESHAARALLPRRARDWRPSADRRVRRCAGAGGSPRAWMAAAAAFTPADSGEHPDRQTVGRHGVDGGFEATTSMGREPRIIPPCRRDEI